MRRRSPHEEKSEEEGEADDLEYQSRGVRYHNQKLAPERQPSDHGRVLDDARGRPDDPLIDPEPGKQSRDQKQDVVVVASRSPRKHVSKDEPVEYDQAEGLQDRPEDTERRAAEPGRKIALHELAEKVDILVRGRPPDLTEDGLSP